LGLFAFPLSAGEFFGLFALLLEASASLRRPLPVL
jgi:hypothetical protein